MNKKTGILLVNLGTPDSPSVKDVRKYLNEFLNDARVIDLAWLKRKLLVNLIIVPLRAPKSAKEYVKLFKMFDKDKKEGEKDDFTDLSKINTDEKPAAHETV